MFGIHYYKADASTYALKTVKGNIKAQGRGISFYYNELTTSIAAIPVNVQEAPFIFKLQTRDFQTITIQGQVGYQIVDAVKMHSMMNFTLKSNGVEYSSEDPMKLSDRVIRIVQAIVQTKVQDTRLREVLLLTQPLTQLVKSTLVQESALTDMGIEVLDISIISIQPTPETARALEAEAREMILKEGDDAIYLRRKAAVEQERILKEAELNTALVVQQKEQEIEESRIENERTLLRAQTATERERLQAEIEEETQRQALVALQVENRKHEADSEAYAIAARMNAFKELPVENLKAIAQAQMKPDQLMALAFEALANNANKINELTITPDLLGQLLKRGK